jgi:hypothetical protein
MQERKIEFLFVCNITLGAEAPCVQVVTRYLDTSFGSTCFLCWGIVLCN